MIIDGTRCSTIALAIALTGCIVQTTPPQGPPPPPPQERDAIVAAPTPQPLEQRSNCRQPKLRERAFCLSKIEHESAIAELYDVAQQVLASRPEQSISPREDFVYAAENAGIVGAKTSTARLFTMVHTGDATAQRFGVIALRHALSLLRMGYAHGGERDRGHRAKILAPTGDLCRERLASREEAVVTEAFRCLAETAEARHAPAVVKSVIGYEHRAAVAIVGVRALAELGPDLPTARPLVRLLENPMPDRWVSDDMWIRAEVCRLLGRHASASDRWVHLPAMTAAQRIGDAHAQAREACEQLAQKTSGGTMVAAPARPASNKRWYSETKVERCRPDRYGILGHAELCAIGEPAGPDARTFSIVLADVGKLDPKDNTRHLAILSKTVSTKAGQYVPYEQVGSYELSDGFWLIVVPIVDGNPEQWTAKQTQLYLLDTANKRWSLAQTSKTCRGANCRQEVQLRRKRDALPIEIYVEGDASERFAWDGQKLAR